LFSLSGSDQVAEYQKLLQQASDKAKNDELELREKLESEEKKLVETLNQLREQCVRLEQDIKSKETNLLSNNRLVNFVSNRQIVINQN
jgi:CCR4-NOT transcriptional regulation complex NOT5 subunit